ncbi:MAG TPA: hypothetical protein VFV49_03925 [Thermoanaerobaculia bacterium]|nr:hypothetical protein [Thermoanaerobaculia bacterium]
MAIIDNAGPERVTSTVAFYDGVPNAGGGVIAVMPIAINADDPCLHLRRTRPQGGAVNLNTSYRHTYDALNRVTSVLNNRRP